MFIDITAYNYAHICGGAAPSAVSEENNTVLKYPAEKHCTYVVTPTNRQKNKRSKVRHKESRAGG